MYDTYIYAERVIPEPELTHAFAQATHSAPGAIAVVDSPDLDGAVDAWSDSQKTTVLRHWTQPGDFPFAVEIVFKQPNISSQQDTVTVLRRIAADVNLPLLSIARDGLGTFLAIFPDGSAFLVDEDSSFPDPALVLTPESQRKYNAARIRSRQSVPAAD